MIFADFDLSPLTLWINCCFYHCSRIRILRFFRFQKTWLFTFY